MIDSGYSGEHSFLYENGNLRFQQFWINGKPEGESREWYVTGNLRVLEFYMNGKKSGKRKYWGENGGIQSLMNFHEGEFHGKYLLWHGNGILEDKTFYQHGIIEGEQKRSEQDGSITRYQYIIRNRVYMDLTNEKKITILYMKRKLFLKIPPIINIYLINDLSGTIF